MARAIANSVLVRSLSLSAALGWPGSAHAEVSAIERAQQLFDEARDLMKAEQYSQACPKLAESQALDPGGGTILNLGMCRRHEGRTATAQALLTVALAQARRDGRRDRERTANKELAALDAVISRLTVRVLPGAAPDLTITVDGAALNPTQLGSALPMDPGEHEIAAVAPGRTRWFLQITLGPLADDQQVTIPELEADVQALPKPAPLPVPVAPLPALVPREFAEAPRAARTPSPDAMRPVGYVALGVGALALGVGSYFGVRSLSLKRDSNRYWNGQYCSQRSCVDDWRAALTSARISDVSVGVSLVAFGLGTYWLLRSPSHEPGPGVARVQVRATPSGAFVSTTTAF